MIKFERLKNMTVEEISEKLEEIKHVMPPESTDSLCRTGGQYDNGRSKSAVQARKNDR